MPNKYLILALESPLQSWGLQGQFDLRDTSPMPTKSGIIGILGSALGVERKDINKIAELSTLHMTVFCTKPGEIITDYHTVGNGYKNRNENLIDAEGKYKKTGIVTNRDYLCDAKFMVVLTGKDKLIDSCAIALDNPRWDEFLGRRACIPTRPILEAVVSTKEEVIEILSKFNISEKTQVQSDGLGGFTQQDVPVNFSTRKFNTRTIVEESDFYR